MIRCPKCGGKNNDNATTCAQCKTDLGLANQEKTLRTQNMLLATTQLVEGHAITKYLGIVSSSVAIGIGALTELGGSIDGSMGKRVGGFQEKLTQARNVALQELIDQAVTREADAVIGLDIDYMVVSNGVIMVSANGTAVQLNGVPPPA